MVKRYLKLSKKKSKKRRSKSKDRKRSNRRSKMKDGFANPSDESLMNTFRNSVDTGENVNLIDYFQHDPNIIQRFLEWVDTNLSRPLVLTREFFIVHDNAITWLVDYERRIKARLDFTAPP